MSRALPLLLACAIFASGSDARGEAAPLIEDPDTRVSYWTLSLLGGGAFPVAKFADERELGLAAGVSLAFTSKSGLGAALSAGYSPLPAVDLDDGVRREHQLGHAQLAPRFTLGRGIFRLFVGGGGAVVYERTKSEPRAGSEPAETTTKTDAGAVAEAGLQLHFAGAGGIVIGGSYLHTTGEAKLAAAKAGFILSF